MQVSVTVNNRLRSADVEPRTLLVDLLRDEFELTGTKSAATPANAACRPPRWAVSQKLPHACRQVDGAK